MHQFTCNAIMAFDLLLPLATARIEYRLTWPRPDCAVFETGDPLAYAAIHKSAEILNAFASGPGANWTAHDDMMFPLLSPADLREGFEPRSNLNLWEDATHQITFDGGKHWTNVILEEGNPAYYVACSDGKRSWLVNQMTPEGVVSRPLRNDREYQGTVTGRISSPQPQPVDRVYGGGRGGRGKPVHEKAVDWLVTEGLMYPDVHCTAHVDYDPASRKPATVGDTPACPMTDTCFDSDPSVVGE